MGYEVDLIQSFPNSLSPEVCQSLIRKFEGDSRKTPGTTQRGLDPDYKRSTDLMISPLPEYGEEDQILNQTLERSFQHYCATTLTKCGWNPKNVIDFGFQIQRTEPGEFYLWHNDQVPYAQSGRVRFLTFIWYLNSLTEDEEGETAFWDGTLIRPEEGKLVLFPATWNFVHMGRPPKKTKYICTGWLYETV
jgi:hypothetical protein